MPERRRDRGAEPASRIRGMKELEPQTIAIQGRPTYKFNAAAEGRPDAVVYCSQSVPELGDEPDNAAALAALDVEEQA